MNNTLNLTTIEKCDNINAQDFQEQFVKTNKPVILTQYSREWPALEKWNYDYLKKAAGNVEVPLFAEAFADKGQAYMKAQTTLPFANYLDLLTTSDTRLRMFLFNLYKKMPNLCADFNYPGIISRYMKKFPFLFFGQKGSHVDLHYDADMSHVFLTQFMGRKEIILFSPPQTRLLYRHPFTVSTNVDLRTPDLQKYPHLKHTQGYRCILNHGETLFMPSGYWHYIYYTDTGFSLSLRAQADKLATRFHGYMNIFNLIVMDFGIGKIMGVPRWQQVKESMAIKRAEAYAKQM
jgi:hypothetical protein